MPRPRNPRREALALLAAVKRTADAIRLRWTVESVVKFDQHARRLAVPHQRTPEEYPENSAHEWKILFAYADSMEESAAKLKALALEKWQAIEGTDHTLKRTGR